MASSGKSYSIVEYFGENEEYRCGYCKSSNSNFSHGLWAHSMSVEDYQSLIDRGWRRSGQYVYKPTMHLICCPMYTIRCLALDFKPTKSQKKVLKRVHHFLATGNKKSDKSDNASMSSDVGSDHGFQSIHEIPYELKEKVEKAVTDVSNAEVKSVDLSLQKSQEEAVTEVEGIGGQSKTNLDATMDIDEKNKRYDSTELRVAGGSGESSVSLKKATKTGIGADSNRPACKKAKVLRLERKKQKLQSQGLSEEDVTKKLCKKTLPTEKSLEDFINEPLPANPAHRLEIRLVNSNQANSEFEATFDAAFVVYQKYQMIIHGDPPSKCNEHQFTRFLVNSPLKFERNGNSPPCGYGSFHQQYWLDNQLIAVGVIDILPNCVSSVYFYYDPDYSDLSLGTYASLRETSFTRSLHYHAPSLKYYYMGFYIDSCPKMRYKAGLKPSFLLCPETYSWHPFEEAHKKIQESKYCRLNNDKTAADSDGCVDVDKVLVLYNNTCMDFKTYQLRKSRLSANEIDQVKQYASLIGMKCAKRLLLYRSGSI